MKLWAELSEDQHRQYIDAKSVFRAWESARQTFKTFAGMPRSLEKDKAKTRLADLSEAMVRNQRLNHALYVGRAPRALVDTLHKQYMRDLTDYIIDSDYALHAYEAAAGIRITPDLLETVRDIRTASPIGDEKLFSSMIVSRSGHMARMSTIAPEYFIAWKRESGTERDLLLAELVEQLIEEYLLDRVKG